MVTYRINFIFRVSVVINIVVLFYTALHLSRTYSQKKDWVQITSDGSEEIFDLENFKTKKVADSRSIEADFANEILNENIISESTYSQLQSLLACNKKDFRTEYLQRHSHWVLKNYVQADHGELDCYESITYTTHASYWFLDNIQPLVERWRAPVSLAIHAPGADIVPTVDSIRYLRDCLDTDLIKQFVTFHVFFEFSHTPDYIPDPNKFLATSYNCSLSPPYMNVNVKSTYRNHRNILYPVNVGRNIARDAALTHFILPSDIELYPSPNLVPKFLNMIARNASPLNNTKNPRVFPISLFEVVANVQVPSTKTEIQKMVKDRTAVYFHKFTCPACHSMPEGRAWMQAEETSQMDVFHVGKRYNKSKFWEPIFIGTHADFHYDDRLFWEGKRDKMTQAYVLCIQDYDFMILNNAILVHKPGIKHHKTDRVREGQMHQQSLFIANEIVPDLEKFFGTKEGCVL